MIRQVNNDGNRLAVITLWVKGLFRPKHFGGTVNLLISTLRSTNVALSIRPTAEPSRQQKHGNAPSIQSPSRPPTRTHSTLDRDLEIRSLRFVRRGFGHTDRAIYQFGALPYIRRVLNIHVKVYMGLPQARMTTPTTETKYTELIHRVFALPSFSSYG